MTNALLYIELIKFIVFGRKRQNTVHQNYSWLTIVWPTPFTKYMLILITKNTLQSLLVHYHWLTEDSHQPHEHPHQKIHPVGTVCNHFTVAIVICTSTGVEMILYLSTVPRLGKWNRTGYACLNLFPSLHLYTRVSDRFSADTNNRTLFLALRRRCQFDYAQQL